MVLLCYSGENVARKSKHGVKVAKDSGCIDEEQVRP